MAKKQIVLSNSELDCFRACRRKWNLLYREGLVSLKKGGKLLTGSFFHAAVEEYFKIIQLVGTKNDQETLSGAMLNALGAAFEKEQKKAKREVELGLDEYLIELDSSKEMAEILIENFLAGMASITDYNIDEVVEIEKARYVKICEVDGVDIMYHVKPDALVKINGRIWTVSLKSVAAIDLTLLTKNDQERGYAWGLDQEGIEIEGCLYLQSRKQKLTSRVKAPLFAESRVIITKEEIREMDVELRKMVKEMMGDPAIYRNSSMECNWKCSYNTALCVHDTPEIREASFKSIDMRDMALRD